MMTEDEYAYRDLTETEEVAGFEEWTDEDVAFIQEMNELIKEFS